jgi:membrane protease YdiL (CAAX protease family)
MNPGLPPQAKPITLPVEPTDYTRFFRTPSWRGWRSVVMIITVPVGFLLLNVIVGTIAGIFIGIFTPDDLDKITSGEMTPLMFLFNNLSLAAVVPMIILAAVVIFKQRGGFMASVTGKFRWKWFFICFTPLLFLFIVEFFAQQFIAVRTGLEGEGELGIYPTTLLMVLTILLTTPLQCAGEEYGIRGALNRATAAFFGNRKYVGPIAGAIVSTAAFAAIHSASDLWLNLMYVTLGLCSCWLVWRTGGLEASIALHVANNYISLSSAPFTDISEIFNREAGVVPPWFVLLKIAFILGSVLIVELLHRKLKPTRVASPGKDQLPPPIVSPMTYGAPA